jgi:sortase A
VISGGVAKGLRRGEIALSVLGISLLGWSLAAVVNSRDYQARQGRAFSALEREAADARPSVSSPPSIVPANVRLAPAPDVDPLVLGRIEIPRIGVSAIVREGADLATLAIAVGHIPGTARPGERGNVGLAGHRDSFFRALRNIRVDDTIRISTAGRRYEYRVDSTGVVAPGEIRVLDSTGDPVLTLVTCYPFGFLGHAPDRFVVRASRLSLLPAASP